MSMALQVNAGKAAYVQIQNKRESINDMIYKITRKKWFLLHFMFRGPLLRLRQFNKFHYKLIFLSLHTFDSALLSIVLSIQLMSFFSNSLHNFRLIFK